MVFLGYRSDTNEYFGRFHIRFVILAVAVLMLFTQLFVTIWWLSYHVWWWFFALGGIILANVALGFAYKTRNPYAVIFVFVYQALFTVLLLAVVINLIVSLCHPYNVHAYIFKHCIHGKGKTVSDCAKSVRIAGAVYFPIYLIFTVINGFCLVVIYQFYSYLRQEHLPSTTPQRTFNESPPSYVPRSQQTASSPVSQPPPPPTERDDPWDHRLPSSGTPTAPNYQNKPITPDWGTSPGYNSYGTTHQSVEEAPPLMPPSHQYQNAPGEKVGHLYDTTPGDDNW